MALFDFQPQRRTHGLEAWESWPIVALTTAQGLNIFVWYVLSLSRVQVEGNAIGLPSFVVTWLPFAVVVAGLAAALSLDGTLIATIAGALHGRRSVWTWCSVSAAAFFGAGISYEVYHGGEIGKTPWLHIAQIVVLLCYSLHLAQTKKPLHTTPDQGFAVSEGINRPKMTPALSASDAVLQTGFTCRRCGVSGFETLADVQKHRRDDPLCGSVSDATQHLTGASTGDTEEL